MNVATAVLSDLAQSPQKDILIVAAGLVNEHACELFVTCPSTDFRVSAQLQDISLDLCWPIVSCLDFDYCPNRLTGHNHEITIRKQARPALINYQDIDLC
jgi:hypothetical protein